MPKHTIIKLFQTNNKEEILKATRENWILAIGDTDSYLFIYFMAAFAAHGSSWARGQIRAAAAGLHHSHNNIRSEEYLWTTPQFMATPDP